MHPSQACTESQLKMFMANSGFKAGLTYRLNYFDEYENKIIDKCMFFLYRVGARLEIRCYKNDKLSHIVDSSYVHGGIMDKWQEIQKEVLTRAV